MFWDIILTFQVLFEERVMRGIYVRMLGIPNCCNWKGGSIYIGKGQIYIWQRFNLQLYVLYTCCLQWKYIIWSRSSCTYMCTLAQWKLIGFSIIYYTGVLLYFWVSRFVVDLSASIHAHTRTKSKHVLCDDALGTCEISTVD